MGSGSSKNKNNDEDEEETGEEEKQEKKGRGRKKEIAEKMGNEKKEFKDEECKAGFYKIVSDTLRTSTGPININKVETLVIRNRQSSLHSFNRGLVIKKVIGDEFIKGCIAVRSSGCPKHW